MIVSKWECKMSKGFSIYKSILFFSSRTDKADRRSPLSSALISSSLLSSVSWWTEASLNVSISLGREVTDDALNKNWLLDLHTHCGLKVSRSQTKIYENFANYFSKPKAYKKCFKGFDCTCKRQQKSISEL